jgi:hypothetical protein
MDVVCLSAQVTLTLSSHALPALEIPPIPILLLPLLIPTVVAMFSEPNFGVLNPTLTLVVVPEHSPLGSLKPLIDAVNKVQNVVDALAGLAQFAGWILGLNELVGALTNQPRVRFINRDKIDSFDDVSIKPGPFFGVLGDDNFDDVANSILMIGVRGTKAWFYNDDNQTTGGDQGYYALKILNDSLYVMVRDLAQTDASSDPPVPYPVYSIPSADWHKDSYGTPTWPSSMSSFQFDPGWLQDMRDDSDNIGGIPELKCVRARPNPSGTTKGASGGAKSRRRRRPGG